MTISLEDGYTDVIGKAQRGLGLSDSQVAERSGISLSEMKKSKEGEVDPAVLRKIAQALQLKAEALIQLAEGKYRPGVEAPAGLRAFNTPYDDYTVNSYLAWDVATREAIIFDTGSDATELLHTVAAEGLQVRQILLTHTHGDHIFDLERVLEKTGAPVSTPAKEPLEGAKPFEEGATFACGSLQVSTLLTHGHSPGGTTFVLHGLEKPVAIVGDALFAGSAGGASAWKIALSNVAEKILTLAPETVICPGHGPLTSVALERTNNPFF